MLICGKEEKQMSKEEQDLTFVDDNEASAYIQDKLNETGIEMEKDKIILIIEHYYGYLYELGLVQAVE